jgi:hypothetical protein
MTTAAKTCGGTNRGMKWPLPSPVPLALYMLLQIIVIDTTG